MFFVINKEKVYAYIVSILTIVTLFFMSNMLNSDISTSEQTSGNLEQNQINVDKKRLLRLHYKVHRMRSHYALP